MNSRGTSGYQPRDRDNGYNAAPIKNLINQNIGGSSHYNYDNRAQNSRQSAINTNNYNSRTQTPLRDRSASQERIENEFSGSNHKQKGSTYDQTPDRKVSSFAARE